MCELYAIEKFDSWYPVVGCSQPRIMLGWTVCSPRCRGSLVDADSASELGPSLKLRPEEGVARLSEMNVDVRTRSCLTSLIVDLEP